MTGDDDRPHMGDVVHNAASSKVVLVHTAPVHGRLVDGRTMIELETAEAYIKGMAD